MFANSYWDAKQIVTVEYFDNGNEPMVSVGYDIYAKNISRGKKLQQNLILALSDHNFKSFSGQSIHMLGHKNKNLAVQRDLGFVKFDAMGTKVSF